MRVKLFLVFLCVFLWIADADRPAVCPKIVTRTDWAARTAVQVEYSLKPTQYVVVHHTVTPPCKTEEACIEIISNIQSFHMDTLLFHDIGYNFLIGGDGRVYEGAGFHKVGAHTRGYNTRSLGIAFIGDFSSNPPPREQLQAAKDFLECGKQLGELDDRYKLIAARQVSSTQSPGLRLYRELQRWDHFTSNA